METKEDFLQQLKAMSFGSRLKRLSDRLMSDVARIYKEHSLDFEPRWFTTTALLYRTGSLSILEIAEMLQISHPAVVQVTQEMAEKKLIKISMDIKDKRKRLVHLTPLGKSIFRDILPLAEVIGECTSELIALSGGDMLKSISQFESAHASQSLYERVQRRLKHKINRETIIIAFEDKYKKHFRLLNEEWLGEFFTIEAIDRKILSQPEKYILKNGGMIFFALYKNSAVGTIAVTRENEKIFSLTKMAVTASYRGCGLGEKLALTAIDFVRRNGGKQIYLETSTKLSSAMALYKKLGFVETEPLRKSEYKRATISMKMIVTKIDPEDF